MGLIITQDGATVTIEDAKAKAMTQLQAVRAQLIDPTTFHT